MRRRQFAGAARCRLTELPSDKDAPSSCLTNVTLGWLLELLELLNS
jgi:hypothetical protein